MLPNFQFKKARTQTQKLIRHAKASMQFYANKGLTPNAFGLTPRSEEYVFELLNVVHSPISTGLDDIPVKFLRDAADSINSCCQFILTFGYISK